MSHGGRGQSASATLTEAWSLAHPVSTVFLACECPTLRERRTRRLRYRETIRQLAAVRLYAWPINASPRDGELDLGSAAEPSFVWTGRSWNAMLSEP
jgi:hypothetical protein